MAKARGSLPWEGEKNQPKKIVRYRAVFEPRGAAETLGTFATELFRTKKDAMDAMLKTLADGGILIVLEVPVKRKQRTEYVEVEGDG